MLLLENSHQCIYNDSTENDSCSFHQLTITVTNSPFITFRKENKPKITTISATIRCLRIFSYNTITRAEASKAKHDFQIITESTDVLLKEERMGKSDLSRLSRVSLCRSQSRILNTQALNGQQFRSIQLRSKSYADNAKLKCIVALFVVYLIVIKKRVHLLLSLRDHHQQLHCNRIPEIALILYKPLVPLPSYVIDPCSAIEAKLIAVWDKNALRRANISQKFSDYYSNKKIKGFPELYLPKCYKLKRKTRKLRREGVKRVVSNRYHRKLIVIVTVFPLHINMQVPEEIFKRELSRTKFKIEEEKNI
uniref:Uncharacterized protein n=1 Tax=Glossina austeni TaxID=7395 RepID=A0A1A9UXE9_GLOAU